MAVSRAACNTACNEGHIDLAYRGPESGKVLLGRRALIVVRVSRFWIPQP